jgi:hypothetical protein
VGLKYGKIGKDYIPFNKLRRLAILQVELYIHYADFYY